MLEFLERDSVNQKGGGVSYKQGALFFFFNVCLFLRESMSGGGAEREGDTESAAGSRL